MSRGDKGDEKWETAACRRELCAAVHRDYCQRRVFPSDWSELPDGVDETCLPTYSEHLNRVFFSAQLGTGCRRCDRVNRYTFASRGEKSSTRESMMFARWNDLHKAARPEHFSHTLSDICSPALDSFSPKKQINISEIFVNWLFYLLLTVFLLLLRSVSRLFKRSGMRAREWAAEIA